MEALSEQTTDEIIIDFVRANHCLYDKHDANFKNVTIKKDLWQKFSEILKHLHKVNMSAKSIEKRWLSLRTMFTRENKRQKSSSSSKYKSKKEWELYRNMLFLSPHITQRKRRKFVQQYQAQSSLLESSTTNTSSSNKKIRQSQSSNLITSPPSDDHKYYAIVQSTEENKSSLNTQMKSTVVIDSKILNGSFSILPSCSNINSIQFSDSSTSSNAINVKNPVTLKSFKKIMPKTDESVKCRRNEDVHIDHDLAKASKKLSEAAMAVSSQIHNLKHCKDGYMSAIEEALKYVPTKNKTQCLIEVLQIIQKYEERQ